MTFLTPKVLFIISLMMVATYTCNAIVFPDDTSDYLNSYSDFHEIVGGDHTFNKWIDYNFDMAYRNIIMDNEISHFTAYSLITFMYIKENYLESINVWKPDMKKYGIFEEFGYTWENPTGGYDTNINGAGMQWFNSDWVQGQGALEWLFGTTRGTRIEEDYHVYLQKVGVEDKPEGNLIDTIQVLLTNLWEGFTQLIRLLTFTNIPNCPMWIIGLLNVFFIPMWIVLIIGIVPYVSDMIKTIASFIESFTPW